MGSEMCIRDRDKGMLDEVTKSMTKQVADLEQKAKEEAGEDFNVNSPKQLGVILFEKLGLPIIKKTKSGYSTDVSVLEQLQGEHPIIETIMEYRTLSKLLSTYLVALHPLINPKYGPHPYPFQSDGDRDRTAFQYGSKSAEHPYPDGSRQANAPDVCTRQRV